MPVNDNLRILRPSEALEDLRRFVDDHDPLDGSGLGNVRTFSTDLRARAARHWCPDHGWVQPFAGRLCAYCMPVMEDDPRSTKVAIFDRMSGMPVINPS